MRKMGLSVSQRKSETLGTERSGRLGQMVVMNHADYTASDLDTKVELIQQLIPLGLIHVQEMLAAEIEELVRRSPESFGPTIRRAKRR